MTPKGLTKRLAPLTMRCGAELIYVSNDLSTRRKNKKGF